MNTLFEDFIEENGIVRPESCSDEHWHSFKRYCSYLIWEHVIEKSNQLIFDGNKGKKLFDLMISNPGVEVSTIVNEYKLWCSRYDDYWPIIADTFQSAEWIDICDRFIKTKNEKLLSAMNGIMFKNISKYGFNPHKNIVRYCVEASCGLW